MESIYSYKIEYASEDQIKCEHCAEQISPGWLQVAKIQVSTEEFIKSSLITKYLPPKSNFHADEKLPVWYHKQCFFEVHSPENTDEIENFATIDMDDQRVILAALPAKPNNADRAPKQLSDESL